MRLNIVFVYQIAMVSVAMELDKPISGPTRVVNLPQIYTWPQLLHHTRKL